MPAVKRRREPVENHQGQPRGVSSTQFSTLGARLPQIPDVPTIAEAGVPGFEATQWYGVVVPARTPTAIVDQLAAEIRRSLAQPDLKKRLEAEGAQPANMGPAEFQKLIRSEIDRWAKVIRAANIQPD